MTRDEKLEAMARAWCEANGWPPDQPLQTWVWSGRSVDDIRSEPGPDEPIWKRHVKTMDMLLKAIGE